MITEVPQNHDNRNSTNSRSRKLYKQKDVNKKTHAKGNTKVQEKCKITLYNFTITLTLLRHEQKF